MLKAMNQQKSTIMQCSDFQNQIQVINNKALPITSQQRSSTANIMHKYVAIALK